MVFPEEVHHSGIVTIIVVFCVAMAVSLWFHLFDDEYRNNFFFERHLMSDEGEQASKQFSNQSFFVDLYPWDFWRKEKLLRQLIETRFLNDNFTMAFDEIN